MRTHSALFIHSTVFPLGAQPCMHLHTHAYVNSHTFTLTRTVALALHAAFDEFCRRVTSSWQIKGARLCLCVSTTVCVHIISVAASVPSRIYSSSNKSIAAQLGCCRLIPREFPGLRSRVGSGKKACWPCRSQMWPLACIRSDKYTVLWSRAALSMSASCLAAEIKASHHWNGPLCKCKWQ